MSERTAAQQTEVNSGNNHYSGQPGTKLRPFSLQHTPASPHGRAVVPLVKTDITVGNLQILNPGGGERQLHSHTAMDGFWMVLKGRIRFYGPEQDTVAAECGPLEGVFVPRNVPYWFEIIGDEQAHLLQVEAVDRTVPNRFIAHGPRVEGSGPAPRVYLPGETADSSIT
jgi:mannose-6-phosphate isomerase-like protein (cupin superfamily)